MRTNGDAAARLHLRTEEFDAFGPWVLPVGTPAEVPPLFRAHLADPSAADVVLKVPRPIDRRDADATMNLYDYLLVVDDAGLTVLHRTPAAPGGFLTRVLPIDRLLALEESTDLLDARLTVHALGAPALTVPFNGSSRDTVGTLVRAVRRRWLPEAPTALATDGTRALIPAGLRDLDADLALVALYREVLAEEPSVRFLGAHPRRVVRPSAAGAGGALTRGMHAVWPMTLHGAVVCSDGRELQVLHRRHWWIRGGRPVNSIARTILPLDRVRTVTVEDHPVYAGVRVVTVGLEGVDLTLPVPAGSATELALVAIRP
ncbi:MAG TPA: hypothetical protein VN257_04315 [Actinotalea sp.]|nr:hypothetical protein [Actinotalea sp.]